MVNSLINPTVPAEIVFNLIDVYWKTENVARPKIVQREAVGELREEIPESGLVLIYAETGGIRQVPRGNRMYKDEIVNVNIECHTLRSHEHLYALFEEVLRICELNTRNVSPYHLIKPMTAQEEYGSTFQYWKGNVRVELNRSAVRTAYNGPSCV